MPTISIWAPRLGVLGLVGILSLFATSIVVMGYPRIVRNALRVLAIALLMAGMLGVSVILTQAAPQLLAPSVIAPVLFSATILLLAYDRRLAIFLSTIQCALVAMALNLRIEWFVLLIAGCGAMIAQLREVRQRNTLIRASAVTALIMAIGSILLDLLTIPAPSEAWLEIVRRGVAVLAAPLAVGFLLLGILPSIERLFDITTGMTLAELRDPARPLLRELQQHAPGTYNHSLQVAAIAEAAADAIGADSLLTYVGAMYHDIGKMNKPEYFVENQAGGFNRHSRLRPAMSLLVIVGHVKDGMELAREYGLPRSIQHFIESHHGTTLVEYFYHAAREQAEGEGSGPVNEIEFRYPGPRPHTREAAILMLADAVESTTRTLTDPSPSRIENLVRDLSRRRLLDDQFSECDLTFSELRQIEDAMIARLCAIHHTRISYPKEEQEDEEDQPEARRAAT